MKKIIFTLLFLLIFMPFAISKQEEVNTIQYLNLDWWNKFNDDKLTGYILSAYENNPDLKVASINTK